LRILIDMNLSPRWTETLEGTGFEARHWSAVGDGAASDREVFEWARRHDFTVLTRDLDFGRLLALTGARSPSVVLLRMHRVLPADLGIRLTDVLRRHATDLDRGAIIALDADSDRVHLLPLRRDSGS
jgi:predicted nuclease of predicted toxin-antitoxin system